MLLLRAKCKTFRVAIQCFLSVLITFVLFGSIAKGDTKDVIQEMPSDSSLSLSRSQQSKHVNVAEFPAEKVEAELLDMEAGPVSIVTGHALNSLRLEEYMNSKGLNVRTHAFQELEEYLNSKGLNTRAHAFQKLEEFLNGKGLNIHTFQRLEEFLNSKGLSMRIGHTIFPELIAKKPEKFDEFVDLLLSNPDLILCFRLFQFKKMILTSLLDSQHIALLDRLSVDEQKEFCDVCALQGYDTVISALLVLATIHGDTDIVKVLTEHVKDSRDKFAFDYARMPMRLPILDYHPDEMLLNVILAEIESGYTGYLKTAINTQDADLLAALLQSGMSLHQYYSTEHKDLYHEALAKLSVRDRERVLAERSWYGATIGSIYHLFYYAGLYALPAILSYHDHKKLMNSNFGGIPANTISKGEIPSVIGNAILSFDLKVDTALMALNAGEFCMGLCNKDFPNDVMFVIASYLVEEDDLKKPIEISASLRNTPYHCQWESTVNYKKTILTTAYIMLYMYFISYNLDFSAMSPLGNSNVLWEKIKNSGQGAYKWITGDADKYRCVAVYNDFDVAISYEILPDPGMEPTTISPHELSVFCHDEVGSIVWLQGRGSSEFNYKRIKFNNVKAGSIMTYPHEKIYSRGEFPEFWEDPHNQENQGMVIERLKDDMR